MLYEGRTLPRTATALCDAAGKPMRLADPQQLDQGLVSFRFEDIEAASAMRYVAEVDGRSMSIDRGGTVRFVPK